MPEITLLALTNEDGGHNKTAFLRDSAARWGWRVKLMYLNKSNRLDRESAYAAKIPKALDVMRNDASDNSVYMMVDAFDTFVLASPEHTLNVFHEFKSKVVWAAEAWMV